MRFGEDAGAEDDLSGRIDKEGRDWPDVAVDVGVDCVNWRRRISCDESNAGGCIDGADINCGWIGAMVRGREAVVGIFVDEEDTDVDAEGKEQGSEERWQDLDESDANERRLDGGFAEELL
jgi:hypothetical protein